LSLDKLKEYEVIFIPDAASNDYERHKILYDAGIKIYILDHHDADIVSEYATVVNNQLCDYPNKQLSGVGIVWQFCRKYLEICEPEKTDLAYQFLDLVATGVMGDMQSLLVPETKFLIWTGFKEENIHNPFIAGMIEKNKFPMTKPKYISYGGLACSPMGAAFFIIPFINAINRSGTMAEKELIFKAMMPKYAFKEVPSTKRGHKAGETERIVD
jgi:single-stranded-DNA-specific exonuclease